MGDMWNGRTKYHFEFTISPSHPSQSAAQDIRN
jgi:hypothetical protein